MLYSASTQGFYQADIHGAAIPPDAITIPDQLHADLLELQAQGAVIQPDEFGMPVAIFPEPPTDAETRAAWRAGVTIDRASFLKALVAQSILPGPEAVSAARGEWPATFAGALGALPIDPVTAQIDWASAANIARLHPLFLAVLGFHAATHDLTAEEAEALGDLIFGWPAPLPPAPD